MSLERSSFTCKLLWCKNFWWRYNSFWRLPIIIKGYLPRGLLHFLVFMLKCLVQTNHIKIFNRLKEIFFCCFPVKRDSNAINVDIFNTSLSHHLFRNTHMQKQFFPFMQLRTVIIVLYQAFYWKKLFYRDWTLWTVSKINHKLIKYLYCSVWNDSRLHLGWQIEIFFSFSTVSDLRFTILVGVSLVFSPPLTMLLICALIFSTIFIGCKMTSGTFINLTPIFCFQNLQIIFISRTSFNKAYLSSKRIRSIDDKDAVTDILNHDLSLRAKLL